MATTFKHRGGWRAQAFDAAGKRLTRNFRTQAEAKDWAAGIEAASLEAYAPELGGPTQATLAQMLERYAHLYTVKKRGAVQELNRIGHYLQAAGLSLLRLGTDASGKAALIECEPQDIDARVSAGWQAHLAARRSRARRTYALIAKLAVLRASAIRRTDIDELVATMKLDGLSESTIQKEVALLKHAFNKALERWNWGHFTNPCLGVKLGGSEHRFVKVTREEITRLYAALDECDNPYFWPLVDAAIFLTARQKSLLKLRWSDINLETRRAVLRKTKTVTVTVPLVRRMVELLGQLPRHPSGFVFPMTENAVDCAWDRVRRKAGLPQLQFRDLRHLGGTYYARLVPNAHVLRQILGHATLHMAEVYINLTEDELIEDLDYAEDARQLPQPPLPNVGPRAVTERTSRKAQRVIAAIRKKYGYPERSAGATEASQGSAAIDVGRPGNVVPLHPRPPRAPEDAAGDISAQLDEGLEKA